ncbi:transposase of IS30 family protein [Spiroplasma phoeniceum P40]|uniref:Transposase of IS30 family protein n=1 Tax=Spiroplasma phoeniceum P40 TaxID=1276259 RepID=A0A345DR05_9MOLU|nr:transposase of IS30 family protein [Spiroplasma phoeniceum P40]
MDTVVGKDHKSAIHWFPKGTDFNNVSQQKINWVVNVINEKLRHILNWRTAKDLFLENFI